MHLYTKRLNLQSVDSGLLYLIIYIRTSKLKLKPKTVSFLTEKVDLRCHFGNILVKTNLFCTKNRQNVSNLVFF